MSYTILRRYDLNVIAKMDTVWSVNMIAFQTGMPGKDLALWTGFFTIAGTAVHSACCVVNDIWDRDLDARIGACFESSPRWLLY